jgi:hypothetical protein
MNDADLEARLARYQPVPPADNLRNRVLNGPTRRSRVEWMSITALTFLIVVLHVLAAGERASVRARLDDSSRHEALVQELAAQFGGDEFARQTARALIEMSAAAGEAE